jgi:hypothetical protein
VVAVGFTVTLAPVTVPTLLSILRLEAPAVAQLNVTLSPAVMVAAEAVKLEIVGAATTVTIAVEVAEPEALVAVNVYVVVVVGETVTLLPATAPTPLLIDKEVALLTDQESVELPPRVIVDTEAEKLAIVGVVPLPGAELPPPPPQPGTTASVSNPMQDTREDTEKRLKSNIEFLSYQIWSGMFWNDI